MDSKHSQTQFQNNDFNFRDRMDEYKSQLEQINLALTADPDNEELLTVKQQLLEVIALMAANEAGTTAATSTTSAQTSSSSPGGAKTKKRTADLFTDDGADDDGDDNDNDNNDDATTAAADGSSSKAAKVYSEPGAPEQVGNWKVGSLCMAKWSVDGNWYEAVVKGITAKCELIVEFDGYGDEDTLTADRLRERDATSEKKKKEKEVTEDPYAELPIPASLKILPSDSDEVRERKKKRVRAIKSKNRLRKIEREKNEAANSWKTFLNKKASAKAVTGFASATKKSKTSIFRSPDTVDGKVGVTGSGSETTKFIDRKAVLLRPTFKPSVVPSDVK